MTNVAHFIEAEFSAAKGGTCGELVPAEVSLEETHRQKLCAGLNSLYDLLEANNFLDAEDRPSFATASLGLLLQDAHVFQEIISIFVADGDIEPSFLKQQSFRDFAVSYHAAEKFDKDKWKTYAAHRRNFDKKRCFVIVPRPEAGWFH